MTEFTAFARLVAQDFAVPDGASPAQFVPELLELLGHPDPIRRDEQAYSILAVWLERGVLDGELLNVGDAAIAGLSHPDILRRSFSALILGECLQRGRVAGLLDGEKAREWMKLWAQWYPNEPDVRSFEDGTGWIHAVAHGADVAGAWAFWPLPPEELQALARLLEARLRSLPAYLNQSEDDRLALALLAMFSQPSFGPQALREWSARYRMLWTDIQPGKLPPGTVLAVRTLHSLHTLLHLGATVGGEKLQASHRAAAIKAVQDALGSVQPYYFIFT